LSRGHSDEERGGRGGEGGVRRLSEVKVEEGRH